MKKAALLSIVLILFGLNSFAQAITSGVTNIGNRLSAINFINANTGFAAGDGGTILKTSNGGATWISQPSGITYDLYAASFPDENTYYAGGAGGLVVKTSNGGKTWQNFTSGSTIAIQSFSFIDADTGFLINGNDRTASKTTDGGVTWNLCLHADQVLYSVCFLDADTGYVSGVNGIIMKTTDGGTTWNYQFSGTTEILFLIYFFDEMSGYAVGSNGTIVHTSDGGATWVSQASGITQRLMCVRFTDINTGYAVGDYGTILKTTNGGVGWNTVPSGTNIDLYGVCFIGADTGFASGGFYANGGIILGTVDGGNTWTNQSNVLNRRINVPADYPTIQQGINAANNGDTVLVQPGTYVENINFNGKRIAVASLFLVTQEESYISQTVIDGNAAGSVVKFENGEDSTTILCGFTLTNGLVNDYYSGGGGIYCYYSSPRLSNLNISNNTSNNGGGIYIGYYSFPDLKNVTVTSNSATNGGGIYINYSNPVFDSINRCNIFLNNAISGSDLFGYAYSGVIKVIVDTFSVLHPTDYHANPLSSFSFDILNGKIEQTEADLYVSPGGKDANSGLTADDPLKTIHHAFQIIYADSLNPLSIHLLEGTYSPSTNGEVFPLSIPEYISLSGASESGVILDADSLSRVLEINTRQNVEISKMTITRGNTPESGGGIYCYGSKPRLQDLSITNNSANYGGGIYFYGSSPELQNVTINNNSAQYNGGGIYFSNSSPLFDSLNRCDIYLNNAPAGSDLFSEYYDQGIIEVIVDTFTVKIPKTIHAFPLARFSFDILHGFLPQENIALFVSPDGDNANTGLTIDDPLKTIQFALSVVNEDHLNIYTLHLLDGNYSASANGEAFPLSIPEYVSMEGESESGVVLDAAGQSRVIEVISNQNVTISNLTVTGGSSIQWGYGRGGGIYCEGSNPDLHNITVTNNYAEYGGGGIYCYSSSPYLKNVKIAYNSANTGGGIFFDYSSPVFDSTNRCNVYFNSAVTGNDLYSSSSIVVVVDTFTVLIPKSFHADPLANFSFDILHGMLPQENIDLYISPGGDNANSGLTADDPLKTVQFALSAIYSDSLNFYKLKVLNGTYSPSANGEAFPLNIPDFVKVEGESENGVILNAEGQSGVVGLLNSQNVEISNLTITGGNSDNGGGIYCSGSGPDLLNLTITGNSAVYGGGGIYFDYNTNPKLQNITITGNSSQYGGGLFCSSSSPVMENVTIANNHAGYAGGGGYFSYSSPIFDSINRCNIYFNSAATGNDLYADVYQAINVIADTFSVLYPTAFHASPLANFSFDILNGKAVQEEADLFVSPGGDNNNSGLTESSPLKTIYCAYSKMLADSLNPHTVYLLAGTYSPSTNGESFPVSTLDFVNLSGVSESAVILDAEGQSRVISKNNSQLTEISNMTVTGGHTAENGGGIYCGNPSLNLKNVSITNNSAGGGGGVYCAYGNPSLENVTIKYNSASSGGGLFCNDGASPALKNVSITNNSAGAGGGIYSYYAYPVFDSINRCNIYLNNAVTGNDLYLESYYPEVMKVVVDTFTVLNPTGFHAWPPANFNFDIWHEKISQVDADLFISPDGDNNNTGLTAGDPLKNLIIAYSKVLAGSQNPHTVHLLPGTYSHSVSDEIFPVQTYDYISLSGESESGVILDAEGQSAVLEINDRLNINISNLTITGGHTDGRGGGISVNNCSPHLQNVTISNNSSSYGGGGIACDHGATPVLENVSIKNNSSSDGGGILCINNSTPSLQNVIVSDNSADNSGGGLCLSYSLNVPLQNVTISNNSAGNEGGGIYCNSSTFVFDSINRCNIFLNSAMAGNDLYSDTFMEVVVDTFTVLYPKSYYALPFNNFSFDIQHGKIPQVNADVFVSPGGDNSNSGLTADNPLKTIQFATAIMAEDSQHLNTIRLLNGTYSASANGETFPIIVPRYISIAGESETGVILDAGNQARVFEFYDNQVTGLSNLTVTGGFAATNGGGIYAKNSRPDLSDIIISNNSSAKHGGGIYFDNSSPDLNHVTISGNSSKQSGGGVYCYYSSPVMQNVVITNDSAGYAGGGIYCASGSRPVLDSVTIANNNADNSGGGMYCNNSDAVLSNVVISGNSSISRGGGMCNNNADPVLHQVRILNNSSQIGGGIYFASSNTNLVNAVIADNSSIVSGGGIYSASSHLKFVNVSMAGNQAVNGGAIFCYNSELELWNSVFWNESASEVYFKEYYDESSISVSYSDIRGGEAGIVTNNNGTVSWLDGNINAEPLLIGTGYDPFALSAGSPCRDAGTPDTTGLYLPLNDLAGNPRIWNDRVDIGAYEWNNVGIENPQIQNSKFKIQNFPNPVISSATFEYELAGPAVVTLKIFNNMSQEVTTLVNEEQSAGSHSVQWNAEELPAGVYYYRIRAGIKAQSGKIIKVR